MEKQGNEPEIVLELCVEIARNQRRNWQRKIRKCWTRTGTKIVHVWTNTARPVFIIKGLRRSMYKCATHLKSWWTSVSKECQQCVCILLFFCLPCCRSCQVGIQFTQFFWRCFLEKIHSQI